MADFVIVAYRPHAGKEAALDALAHEHVPLLRRLGLATDRPATIARAAGGVIVECFEWADGGIALAHHHPEVQALWRRYAEVCDYVPLAHLPEARELFAQFAAIATI